MTDEQAARILEYPVYKWSMDWDEREDGLSYCEAIERAISALRSAGKCDQNATEMRLGCNTNAHIDREAREPCGYCAGAKYVYGHASAVVPNGDKGQIEIEVEGDFDYCPECGRPLTDEAWGELEKRLRG